MSRIGKLPIPLPQGVVVQSAPDGLVTIKGPKGTLSRQIHPRMIVEVSDGTLLVKRPTDQEQDRALHGLTRSLVNNMVVGVSAGYKRILEIEGVGYRAAKDGKKLVLSLWAFRIRFRLNRWTALTLKSARTRTRAARLSRSTASTKKPSASRPPLSAN